MVKNSIILKFFAAIVICLTIVMLVWGGYSFYHEKSSVTRSIESNMAMVMNRIAINIASPLWNYDKDLTEKIVLMDMPDPLVDCVLIVNKNNERQAGKFKTSQGEIRDYDEQDLVYLKKQADVIRQKDIIYEDNKIGQAFVYFSQKSLNLSLNSILVGTIIQTLILFITILIVLYVVMNRLIMKNLTAISGQMHEISQGKGDLTVRLNLNTTDEIGQLAVLFDRFIDILHNDMKAIKTITGNLRDSSKTIALISNDLAARSEEQASSLEVVFSTLEDFTATFEQIIQQDIDQQNSAIFNTITGIESLSSGIKSIDNNIAMFKKKSSDNVNSIHLSKEKIQLSLNETGKIYDKMQEVGQKIKAVGDYSAKIDGILRVIRDISEQTNMLSMNAAIESAHAGELGKGFAIVAGEVRNLAESSSQSAIEISKIISFIKSGVNDSIKITSEGEKLIDAGKKVSREAEESLEEIIQNTKESEKMITSIVESSQTLNHETINFMKDAENLKIVTGTIKNKLSEKIVNSKQIISSLDHVNKATEENAKSNENFSHLAEDLETHSIELSGIVGMFKLRETDQI